MGFGARRDIDRVNRILSVTEPTSPSPDIELHDTANRWPELTDTPFGDIHTGGRWEVGIMKRDGLTLSSERAAAKVYGEEETDDLKTRTHLIVVLQCIVDMKTLKTLL